MRKLSVICLLLMIGTISAQAIKYGVTGNLHKTSIANTHDYSKTIFGGSVGFFADVALVPNDIYDSSWLYFNPQIEYAMQGENADRPKTDLQKYHNNYVGLPLLIKYFLRNHGYKGDIYLFAGPRFEFLITEKREGPPADFESQEQNINSFGYGLTAGVGVKIDQRWDVFLRFDRGLSKVYPDYTRDTTYNRMIGIGLNYYVGETR